MNGFGNRKSHDRKKPVPGCLGRIVTLFDMGPSMGGNRLLAEKEHRHVAPPHHCQVGTTNGALDLICNQMEDELDSYQFSRSILNKKPNKTPVKMLMAQEMSKQTVYKQKPTTIVAKLMGHDGIPTLQQDSTLHYEWQECYDQNAYDKPGYACRHQYEDRGTVCRQLHSGTHPSPACVSGEVLRDVSSVRQQPSNINTTEDQSLQEGISNENPTDKIAFVRQKFIEAKRLATDEKLRQSKEFQDALEVLSSNRDLFLKFLQEPNSLFSIHLCERQSSLLPSQAKHITVLKPSKPVEVDHVATSDSNSDKQINKCPTVEANSWGNDKACGVSGIDHQTPNIIPHPTRIVVLKPSLGKTHDIKAVASSPSSSPEYISSRSFSMDSEVGSMRGCREIAKEITRQMRESLTSGRDESLLSSMVSNGHVGDGSSFNQLENGFIKENLSNVEITSPVSRHSWDYMNRNTSGYSSSFFGKASYSLESSVSEEAKKRLSERWAMMSSTGSGQERRHMLQGSSTLGEVLTLFDNKRHIISGEMGPGREPSDSRSWLCGGDLETRGAAACSSSGEEDSPMTLSRSRSVPTSCTPLYKEILKAATPDIRAGFIAGKHAISNEPTKIKSGRLSLRGKVSSLFFSKKNKKPNEKSCLPSLAGASLDGCPSSIIDMRGNQSDVKTFSMDNRNYGIADIVVDQNQEEACPHGQIRSSCRIPLPYFWSSPRKVMTSSAKSGASEYSSENQDQPSPISVLEASFEEATIHPKNLKRGAQGHLEHHWHHTSELALRSTADAFTCSLSCDHDSMEFGALNHRQLVKVSSKAGLDEKECLSLVQSLLSDAGLDSDNSESFFEKCRPPAGPLDPILLENFMIGKDYEQQWSEAKRRQWRSERRLLYDSVNLVLLDMAVSALSRPLFLEGKSVVEEVWQRVREQWFHSDIQSHRHQGDIAFMLEWKEVAAGKKWEDGVGLEVDGIGEEIEVDLLKQLLEEAISELHLDVGFSLGVSISVNCNFG